MIKQKKIIEDVLEKGCALKNFKKLKYTKLVIEDLMMQYQTENKINSQIKYLKKIVKIISEK